MNKQIILLSVLLGLLLFGCSGRSTGSGSFNPVSWNSGQITNSTYAAVVNNTIQLPDPKSVHTYLVNTSYGATFATGNSLNTTATKSCNATFGAGTFGKVENLSNTSTVVLMNLSNATLTLSLNATYRNTTQDNITLMYQNVSGENVTAYSNGLLLGFLNNSTNTTTFTVSGSYLTLGVNTFQFAGFATNSNKTNVTNVTVYYVKTYLTCSDSDTQADGLFAVNNENTSTNGALILTITNAALNNSTSFNLTIFGGDINVTVNTNDTFAYVLTKYGYVDTFSNKYPLPWNQTGFLNITNLDTSIYASNGSVTVYFTHQGAGNVLNYGAAVDYMGVQAMYATYGTSAMTANITMQGSYDCMNWQNMTTLTSVTTPVMGQINATYGCVRFNVTGISMNSTDALQIHYVGTG